MLISQSTVGPAKSTTSWKFPVTSGGREVSPADTNLPGTNGSVSLCRYLCVLLCTRNVYCCKTHCCLLLTYYLQTHLKNQRKQPVMYCFVHVPIWCIKLMCKHASNDTQCHVVNNDGTLFSYPLAWAFWSQCLSLELHCLCKPIHNKHHDLRKVVGGENAHIRQILNTSAQLRRWKMYKQ